MQRIPCRDPLDQRRLPSKTTRRTSMKTCLAFTGFLLQFFPLTVFLRVAFFNGAPQASDWLHAFVWGGGAAILQFALFGLFLRARPMNRMMLSVNVYLIFGGSIVLTRQMVLLDAFKQLKESGLFLCLLAVGIATTLGSKSGFVGAHASSRQRDVKVYSLGLILLTCLAVAASFWFRGNMMLSAVIPFIVLSIATRIFKQRLSRAAGA